MIVLFEGTIRVSLWFRPVLDRLERLDETGRRVASLSKYALAGGGQAGEIPAMSQVMWRHDADLGWGLAPGDYDSPDGGYTIRAGAYRGLRPAAAVKDRLRVAGLGDSFGFGDEVNDGDVWTSVLARTSGAEVLNFGVIGYGHDQMLLTLRRDVWAVEPDVVVLVFVAPDIVRNRLRFHAWAKPRFVLEGSDLVLRGTPVPGPEALLAAQWWRPRTVDFLQMWVEAARRGSAAQVAQEDALTTAIVRTMAEETVARGARFVAVYGPEPSDWQSERSRGRDLFGQICSDLPDGAVCTDATPKFRQAVFEGETLMRRTHWSPGGHALVGEAVEEALHEVGALP
jgi:hypothetical protein